MQTMSMRRPWAAVLVGGGIAATLDIVYAILRNGGRGRTPLWVLQSVASGWFGEEAFNRGVPGGAIGLLSHYGILFIAAAVYLIAARRWLVLQSRAALCGLAFGVGVYLFMNFVVLPLSAFPFHLTYPWPRLIEGFASHAVFVGLPIALACRYFDHQTP